MTRHFKTYLTTAAAVLTLTATSAWAQTYPSDFAALDADNNGQVTFAEYSAVVKTSGTTTTAAAQQFTRISAGDAVITEDELNLALAFQDQPYALQNINNEANVSFVSAAPEFEPPVTEVQDSPVTDSEPIIMEEAPVEVITDTPAPQVDIIRDPVPELKAPTVTTTEPEIIMEEVTPEMPDADITAPEEARDILLEEEVEPQPEG